MQRGKAVTPIKGCINDDEFSLQPDSMCDERWMRQHASFLAVKGLNCLISGFKLKLPYTDVRFMKAILIGDCGRLG